MFANYSRLHRCGSPAVQCAVALLVLLLSVGVLPSASDASPDHVPMLSDEVEVSMITMLPGRQVHALFGHSALRVRDPVRGIDEVFNYGTFDFTDPLFVPKFMHGQMDYFLSVQSPRTLPRYALDEGRPVIEQVLNLTPEQANTVYRFLAVNAQPENRYYRYDFFFDNCSTRILDLFEDNLTGEVEFTYEDAPDASFRELLEPYLWEQPFLRAGIDVLLGSPTDRRATPRETAFLPDHLMYMFDEASVEIDGEWMPLVARTDTLEWVPGYERAQPALSWPTIFGWLLLVAALLVSGRPVREGSMHGDLLSKLLDAVLYGLTGVLGLIIFYLWFISEHVPTALNLNLLWAWPTHLVVVIALLRRVESRWLGLYLVAAALVTFIFVLMMPLWPQAFPGFALPMALAIIARSAGIAYVRRKQLVEMQPV